MLFGDTVRPPLRLESYKDPSLLSKKIKDEIVQCARAGFGDPSMSKKEIHDHLVGTVDVVTDISGKVVGFGSTVHRCPQEVSNGALQPSTPKPYFAGSVIDPVYQGSGAYDRIIDARLQRVFTSRAPAVLTRTQQPKVEAKITQALEIAKLRKEISDFRLSRTPLTGFYGRMLTAEKPKVNSTSPYAKLNYGRGDAYVLEYTIEY